MCQDRGMGRKTNAQLQAELAALKAENERLQAGKVVQVTARIPAILRDDVRRVASDNDMTMQAAIQWGMEHYLEAHGKA